LHGDICGGKHVYFVGKMGALAKNSSLECPLEEQVAERNVELMVEQVKQRSEVLTELEATGEIGIVGAMYNIETGIVEFYNSTDSIQDAV
jgi:carbonic anhydrase